MSIEKRSRISVNDAGMATIVTVMVLSVVIGIAAAGLQKMSDMRTKAVYQTEARSTGLESNITGVEVLSQLIQAGEIRGFLDGVGGSYWKRVGVSAPTYTFVDGAMPSASFTTYTCNPDTLTPLDINTNLPSVNPPGGCTTLITNVKFQSFVNSSYLQVISSTAAPFSRDVAGSTQSSINYVAPARVAIGTLTLGTPSCTLSASPNAVVAPPAAGSTLTLTTSAPALVPITSAVWENGSGAPLGGGTRGVSVGGTTTYSATVTNAVASASCSVTITVTPPPPPTCTMWADAGSVVAGTGTWVHFVTSGYVTAASYQGIPLGSPFIYNSYETPSAATVAYYGSVSGVGSNSCSTTITAYCPLAGTVIDPPFKQGVGSSWFKFKEIYNNDPVACSITACCMCPIGTVAECTASCSGGTPNTCWNRGPVPGCFAPETPMLLADGTTVEAQKIKAGDVLWNPVRFRGVKVAAVVLGLEELPLIELDFGVGAPLVVSHFHPLAMRDGMRLAKDLRVGDKILDQDLRYRPLVRVRKLPVKKKQFVWNFRLDVDSSDENDHLIVGGGIVTGDHFLQARYERKNDVE